MTTQSETMTESEFRALAKTAYNRVEAQFEDVDPDVVECEVAQGALTLILADGAKWVLSQQPPVRQLWLAVASKGRAFHFDYDPERKHWLDDKGEGIELMAYLAEVLKEEAGVNIRF